MSMRTFHRGSALRAASGARFVMALTYHGTAARWMDSAVWPSPGVRGVSDRPEIARFIERATPRQRESIGFPPRWPPVLERRDARR
jgi:hypothetical protein